MNRDTVNEIYVSSWWDTERRLKRCSPGPGREARPARCPEPSSCPSPKAPPGPFDPFSCSFFFGRFSLPRSGHSFHLTCRCSLAPCDCGACKRPPASPGARQLKLSAATTHHLLAGKSQQVTVESETEAEQQHRCCATGRRRSTSTSRSRCAEKGSREKCFRRKNADRRNSSDMLNTIQVYTHHTF